jgi:hypothetical protein
MASTAPLKNKRLSQSNREALYRLAEKQVKATEDSTTLDNAYEHAATAIHDVIVARFPQKDMRVLLRYEAAREDPCVYISSSGYNYDQFTFRNGDKRITLRPGRNCNHGNPYILEGEAQKAFDAFQNAENDRKLAIKARLDDFKALIFSANTFNEVAGVWPAAEAMRETIVGSGTALTVLSSDVVARIRADAAADMELAA